MAVIASVYAEPPLELWSALGALGQAARGGVEGFNLEPLIVPSEIEAPRSATCRPQASPWSPFAGCMLTGPSFAGACLGRVVGQPLMVDGDWDEAAVRTGASAVWAAAQRLLGGEQGKRGSSKQTQSQAVASCVLLGLRRRMAEAEGGQKPFLGASALGVVRALGCGGVDAEVLGHVLPLCFAMMEEYESEDLMVSLTKPRPVHAAAIPDPAG
jgi:hypothetical protein